MDWLLVAARTVHFAATIALFGIFAFDCLIGRPALAAAGIEPQALPRFDRRLRWLAWTSLVLALVSGAAWLVAVTAAMSGEPLTAALSHGTWVIVLTRTDFGRDWLLRLGLAGLAAACLVPGNANRGRPARWGGIVAAAALLAGLAWAGHGAATLGGMGRLHLAADILHLLAAGLWLGMLLPLALLLAEARRHGNAGGARLAGAAAARFSALGMGSVAVLLASGIVNSAFLVGSLAALAGTAYGRLLLAKIALFLAMLTIAAVNLLRLAPHLGRSADGTAPSVRRAVCLLRRNALAEAALGLAVLGLVGALGILPPAAHRAHGPPPRGGASSSPAHHQ
jgi:putative copper resistance protein D